MKQHPTFQELGKVCNTCRHFDVMEGYCAKKSAYKHGYDYPCDKWQKVERVQLLDPQQTKCNRPTSQEMEDFFNDA